MSRAPSQLEALLALLKAILPKNRFQAARLKGTGTAEITSLEEFTQRCPFTTKADLVADHQASPPYGTNLTVPQAKYTRFCQTSGTTAYPLAILDTPKSWDWLLENWVTIYSAAKVMPGESVYFAFSFGPFLGFWTAFEAAAKCGFRCIPGGGLSSVARLRALIRTRADVLCCTPTYALHLAEAAENENIDLRKAAVRKIIVAGEPGGGVPTVRERISSLWNHAAVLDHYGMTEVGPVAYEKLGEPGKLRVIENAYFAEVIDPKATAPVNPGEIGELVLTTLGRTDSPLLRYRTGDLVRRAPGTDFVMEGGILGRADDMVVVRGVNIYPSAVDDVVRSIPEIAEYRVRIFKRGEMAEIALDAEANTPIAVHDLECALTEAFTLRIPVKLAEPGSLPRFEFKARRWITE